MWLRSIDFLLTKLITLLSHRHPGIPYWIFYCTTWMLRRYPSFYTANSVHYLLSPQCKSYEVYGRLELFNAYPLNDEVDHHESDNQLTANWMIREQVRLLQHFNNFALTPTRLELKRKCLEKIWRYQPEQFNELMLSTYLLRGFTWESHEYFLHWILNMVQAMPQHDFKVIDVVRWFHGSFEARPPYAPKPAWSIRDLNRLSLLLENKPLQWNDPIVAIQRLYISNGPREPKILGSIYRDVYEFFPPETHLALAASGAAPENINHQDVIYIFNAMNGLPTPPCSNSLVVAGVELKISPEQWLIYHQTPIEEPVSDVVGIF